MFEGPQRKRAVRAIWIAIAVDLLLAISEVLFDLRPEEHPVASRIFYALATPAQAITMSLVPGHTWVQPLFGLGTTIVLTFAIVWAILWLSDAIRSR